MTLYERVLAASHLTHAQADALIVERVARRLEIRDVANAPRRLVVRVAREEADAFAVEVAARYLGRN